MKILFTLGTLKKGGAERVVTNLSNYLVKDNNEVIITTTIKGKTFYELNTKIKLYGLEDEKSRLNFIMKNRKRLTRKR